MILIQGGDLAVIHDSVVDSAATDSGAEIKVANSSQRFSCESVADSAVDSTFSREHSMIQQHGVVQQPLIQRWMGLLDSNSTIAGDKEAATDDAASK